MTAINVISEFRKMKDDYLAFSVTDQPNPKLHVFTDRSDQAIMENGRPCPELEKRLPSKSRRKRKSETLTNIPEKTAIEDEKNLMEKKVKKRIFLGNGKKRNNKI